MLLYVTGESLWISYCFTGTCDLMHELKLNAVITRYLNLKKNTFKFWLLPYILE